MRATITAHVETTGHDAEGWALNECNQASLTIEGTPREIASLRPTLEQLGILVTFSRPRDVTRDIASDF